MYSSKQVDEDIDTIMREFDWNRVQRAMLALDWRWFGDNEVPTIAKLRQCARRLLEEAVTVTLNHQKKKAEFITGTGGFRAEARRYKDSDKIYLRLSFNVSEWDNYE